MYRVTMYSLVDLRFGADINIGSSGYPTRQQGSYTNRLPAEDFTNVSRLPEIVQ